MDLRRAQIRLHIEELIVHGVPVGDGSALGDALRSELTRLLSAEALPSGLRRNRRITSWDAGTLRVTSPQPRGLASQVAQVVRRSLSNGSPGK
jgi:hypothetical protein